MKFSDLSTILVVVLSFFLDLSVRNGVSQASSVSNFYLIPQISVQNVRNSQFYMLPETQCNDALRLRGGGRAWIKKTIKKATKKERQRKKRNIENTNLVASVSEGSN